MVQVFALNPVIRSVDDPNSQTELGQVVISIEDSGVGIPEDKIEEVFDLFYSTKKAEEGTGIGMWMSYELVKKYQGEIDISSQVGTGTKVTMVFPEG